MKTASSRRAPASIDQYLDALEEPKRAALAPVRRVQEPPLVEQLIAVRLKRAFPIAVHDVAMSSRVA
jgi:hypothetical protein